MASNPLTTTGKYGIDVAASQDDLLTFLDLLKMLGFNQVTVSDGNLFAHQIKIQ